MVNLETPLKNIPRVTPKYGKILDKMGLFTVRDLLLHLPFRYDDFRNLTLISHQHLEQIITVEGQITKARNNAIWRRRMTVTEVTLEDDNGTPMKAVWFNQPFILQSLSAGTRIRLSGKLILKGKIFQMNSPAWEKASREETNTARLVPVYPETAGISSKWIRWQVKEILPLAEHLEDPIPKEILEKYHLPAIADALQQIHFPDSSEKLLRAQKRIAFQEMFLIQLKTLRIKKEWEKNRSIEIVYEENLIKEFIGQLPFQLTNAQKNAAREILLDLAKPRPMNRLLNGDVGSGKTIVAAIAALEATSGGYQAALMAPTEVLARQHFLTFSELFSGRNINIALLTNSYQEINASSLDFKSEKGNKKTARGKLLKFIAQGKLDLVIGTHALIQKDVRFKNLALVIIDEQHRFGVSQRAALQSETMSIKDGNATRIPHLLTMTATPIPRTLAIAFFGSLDLSLLDEMPKNRKPTITRAISASEREKIYEFIKSEIKKGRQAFVILPLVEESKAEMMVDVKAVTQEHARLSKDVFAQLKLGLLHGRLKAKEKEDIMRAFHEKKLDILVSTSVVEVGIDVPNATIIVIENAERFGLSQLHQFRGRVGRGIHQSYCFLFSENSSSRLKIMEKTNDGFKIAERDLELRGPGQFFGTLQSGLPDITMEHLGNLKLIKFARADAQEILEKDPELKGHPALQNALLEFGEKIHLE